METYFKTFFIILLSLVLVSMMNVQLGSPINGRKDPKDYWGHKMNEQYMPKAIKDFINQRSYEGLEKKGAIKDFIKDFDPTPNVSVYHDDIISKEMELKNVDCNSKHEDDELASKKLFADEFEPIPNVSVYND
ncbi:organ-specific protein S2-like [Beta vulgaris subsp. vulgaris]|uniref:organ-specific protein S2-like n=1 Tax=Beta vulgaris subsp. vulgaris TaxID=3555 RepID=UPI002548FFBA|nr:organ-specific protein S2-like [Beta vulgaris subsp. vulgaris]